MKQLLEIAGLILCYPLIGMLGLGMVWRTRPKWAIIESDEILNGGDLFWGTVFWPLLLLIAVGLMVRHYLGGVFSGYLDWVNHRPRRGKDIVA